MFYIQWCQSETGQAKVGLVLYRSWVQFVANKMEHLNSGYPVINQETITAAWSFLFCLKQLSWPISDCLYKTRLFNVPSSGQRRGFRPCPTCSSWVWPLLTSLWVSLSCQYHHLTSSQTVDKVSERKMKKVQVVPKKMVVSCCCCHNSYLIHRTIFWDTLWSSGWLCFG